MPPPKVRPPMRKNVQYNSNNFFMKKASCYFVSFTDSMLRCFRKKFNIYKKADKIKETVLTNRK
ncbi:hypothetical protein F230042K4_17350 [Mediterraneibacter glycyrrhizinilyticus]